MSKPKITGAVRLGTNVYREGQESELAAVASASELKRLADKGVISGDFKGSKSPEPAPEPAAETAAPDEAAETETEEAAPVGKSGKAKSK